MKYYLAIAVNLTILVQVLFFQYDLLSIFTVFLLEVPIIMIFAMIKIFDIEYFSKMWISFAALFANIALFWFGMYLLGYYASLHEYGIQEVTRIMDMDELINREVGLNWVMIYFLIFHGYETYKFRRNPDKNKIKVIVVLKFNSLRSIIAIVVTSIGTLICAQSFDYNPTWLIVTFIVLKILWDLLYLRMEERALGNKG